MSSVRIAVTGATGALGGLVARQLVDRGIAPRLIVRDPTRLAPPLSSAVPVAVATYGDATAMRSALDGISTLLLVSAAESEDRVQQHLTAVDAAAAAGVERVVYISFLGAAPGATFTLARHHWLTEQRIIERGLRHTFLRDSLYQDVFAFFVGPDGVLRGPAEDGRVGAVARTDVADAAVRVLLAGADDGDPYRHDGRHYDLTGPAALTLYDVAEELSRATGRSITYHPETLPEAYASRQHYGAPDWEVAGWVTSYAAIATGELDVVTDDVALLTGHGPTSFADFLAGEPRGLNRLRA